MSERVQIGNARGGWVAAVELATSSPIVKLAVRTSLIVGSLLNLINQGDALFGAAALDPLKLGLTYHVPYCVATYSAISITLQHNRDAPSTRA